ncbi:MAG TPA: SdrD B-like domain-containing protein, partial [Anaeromyxobacteraceae bacterium]|nr:SdrD B-like domain-containing protein [Anaeromyxobacteraceae bacterium]
MGNRIDRIALQVARVLVATTLAGALPAGAVAQSAWPVTLQVESAVRPASGPATAVSTFRYMVNLDNTGTTVQRSPADGCSPASPGYPASCTWTSIAGVPGSSPVVAQGTQADLPISLPDGRYLVSVLADGYKLDGVHFTVSGGGTGVTVRMQPYPLPAATIQASVFEDISPVNGAPDLPAEHGLAGFQGKITDYLGEVTTDLFGNPLCTEYQRDASGQVVFDADGAPVVAVQGGACLSKCWVVSNGVDVGTVPPVDAFRCPTTTSGTDGFPAGLVVEGKLVIPNLGPNRYALSISPPNGSGFVQTTTLEGNLDWDAWVMEGATGLDTEFVVAGEPFPAVFFGYVPGPSLNRMAAGSAPGRITGVVEAVKIYVPTKGGVANLPGTIWGGLAGAKIDRPIPNPWVTLTDLTNGDTVVWVGRGAADGSFAIEGVPAGNYSLTWWDEKLNYILDLTTVTVGAGETVDLGILPLTGWWTRIEGYVFEDTNRNGVMDPGERGIPGYTLTMRKRENSLMDRGATVVTTDASGHYVAENAYPMTQWLVLEAYDDQFYTTGVTYQADNQPTPTTHKGAGVDVSVLPIIGLSGRIDWGKHRYDPTGTNGVDPQNGGIVGTVSYDTTRNELDPRYAAAEDWQPGISGLTVELWTPVDCGTNAGAACDATGWYELASDGSYAKGKLLNTYVTESWQRPAGCTVR